MCVSLSSSRIANVCIVREYVYTERENTQNGGQTMNEKMANQIAEMKKQTIGVEVEMNNIKRDKAAKTAAGFFGTNRYEYTDGRNGYSTWSAWDAQGREWKFQKDVSISGIDEENPDTDKWALNNGYIAVTPIKLDMTDYDLMDYLD